MKKILLAAGAAVAAFAFASPASAESVNLSGTVNQVCHVTPGNTNVNFGTLNAQGEENPIALNYAFYCNVRWDASVSSTNGRLLNISAPPGSVGPETGPGAHSYNGSETFFAALDYTVDIGPGWLINSASFDGGDSASVTEQDPAAGNFSLVFDTVELTGDQQLVAGSYKDTITLTITPQGL